MSDQKKPADLEAGDVLRARVANAVLDARSDAIIACDRDGIIRFWNPGAARIFGFTAEDALGRSLDIIIPERLRARHWEGYRRMMTTGQSRYADSQLLSVPGCRKDGSQVSVEFTINALKNDLGEPTHLVAVMRDVTERFDEMKKLRAQLRDKTTA
jgi:PAS domain S-box-containing protein